MASAQSSQGFLKPTAPRPSATSPSKSSSSSIPKAPVTVHPTATIPDTTTFQGTYPVTIGAGTVFHPRARILSYEGPITIGESCIISEKVTIGNSPSSNPTDHTIHHVGSTTSGSATIIEDFVSIGPLANIATGSRVRYAASVDASASLGRGVQIGRHAKVCPGCDLPNGNIVNDWVVIWFGGFSEDGENSLRRRKRARGIAEEGHLGGDIVETGRLLVLNKERDGLAKLIGTGAARKR